MKYLAYGSNLNLKMMEDRLGKVNILGVYKLVGYRLVCDNYLSVEKKENSFVMCGKFEIDESDEILLDEYEDYPGLYHKEYIDGCLIYVKNNITNAKPSDQYIKDCLNGFKDFNFDDLPLIEAFNEAKQRK